MQRGQTACITGNSARNKGRSFGAAIRDSVQRNDLTVTPLVLRGSLARALRYQAFRQTLKRRESLLSLGPILRNLTAR